MRVKSLRVEQTKELSASLGPSRRSEASVALIATAKSLGRLKSLSNSPRTKAPDVNTDEKNRLHPNHRFVWRHLWRIELNYTERNTEKDTKRAKLLNGSVLCVWLLTALLLAMTAPLTAANRLIAAFALSCAVSPVIGGGDYQWDAVCIPLSVCVWGSERFLYLIRKFI